MKRVENWHRALAEFVDERLNMPFAWGVNDCCIFSADWLLKLTGVDTAADIRGSYDSYPGACRITRARGGVFKIAEGECAKNEWAEVPVLYAQRGDLIGASLEAGDTLGVCIGGVAAFPAEFGIETRPLRECVRAWRIE